MTESDQSHNIIASTLSELKQRWPVVMYANRPNVISFLNFRLRRRVPDSDRERIINMYTFNLRLSRITIEVETGSEG